MKRTIVVLGSTLLGVMGCSATDKPAPKKTTAISKPRESAAITSFAIKASGEPTVSQLKVGTETVTAADMWADSRKLLADRAAVLPPHEYNRFVQERSAQMIIDKITEMLLYQRASQRFTEQMEKNVDRYIDQEVRKIVTAEHGGVQRRYEQYLEKEGTSLETVRQRFRREAVITAFLENEIKPKLEDPTRAELWTLYESGRQEPSKPERRRMSLVDVRNIDQLPADTTDPSRDQQAAAKAKARAVAEQALAELRGGADFADVARKHSGGLRAAEGGAFGWVAQGTLRERFEPAVDALYQLEEARFSEVIETPDGYFVVRCDKIEKEAELTFESAQPILRERFFRDQYNKQMNELVEGLRAKTTIEPTNLDIFHKAVVEAALTLTPPPTGP